MVVRRPGGWSGPSPIAQDCSHHRILRASMTEEQEKDKERKNQWTFCPPPVCLCVLVMVLLLCPPQVPFVCMQGPGPSQPLTRRSRLNQGNTKGHDMSHAS